MAQMSCYEDDFESLWNMEFHDIAVEGVQKAAPILEKEMKKAARACIWHEGDSEMIDSISASKIRTTKDGAVIVNVGPRGYSKVKKFHRKSGKSVNALRTYPVSNALKAIWKEYGYKGRPAQPFIVPARNAAENEIHKILQDTFDRKVDSL
jgi:HK97 gp10 family phage protein